MSYRRFGTYEEFQDSCQIEKNGLLSTNSGAYTFEKAYWLCKKYEDVEVIANGESDIAYCVTQVYLLPEIVVNVGDFIDGLRVVEVEQVNDMYGFRVIRAKCGLK